MRIEAIQPTRYTYDLRYRSGAGELSQEEKKESRRIWKSMMKEAEDIAVREGAHPMDFQWWQHNMEAHWGAWTPEIQTQEDDITNHTWNKWNNTSLGGRH